MLPLLAILNNNIYLYIAIGGTALFVIKLLMFMFGGDGHGDSHDFGSAGHHDLGHADGGDLDHSGHMDSTATFNIFTIQGFLAFLMGFGWMGYTSLAEWQLGDALAVILATAFGIFLMLLSATLMHFARRMEKVIPFDVRAAVGQVGEVQLHIPAAGQGVGEVQLVVQGRQKVLKAKTSGPEIKSFTRVKVIAVESDRVLTVEPA